jgi:hypothetical protein
MVLAHDWQVAWRYPSEGDSAIPTTSAFLNGHRDAFQRLETVFRHDRVRLVPQVLNAEQVAQLRGLLDDMYRRLAATSSGRRYLLPSEILQTRELWQAALNETVVQTLKEILGPGYTMMPDLSVPRNSFGLPKTLHRDCDSEGR